eukprot:3025073-Rhodomonas_salina.1
MWTRRLQGRCGASARRAGPACSRGQICRLQRRATARTCQLRPLTAASTAGCEASPSTFRARSESARETARLYRWAEPRPPSPSLSLGLGTVTLIRVRGRVT